MIIKFEKFRYQDFEYIEKDIKDILNNIDEVKYNNIMHHNGITIDITFKEIIEIVDISNDIIRVILLLKDEHLQLKGIDFVEKKVDRWNRGSRNVRVWDWGRGRGERMYKNIKEFKINVLDDIKTDNITLTFI
jgi:hypothetical protein